MIIKAVGKVHPYRQIGPKLATIAIDPYAQPFDISCQATRFVFAPILGSANSHLFDIRGELNGNTFWQAMQTGLTREKRATTYLQIEDILSKKRRGDVLRSLPQHNPS